MNKSIFVAFVAGAAVGAASAFYYAKKYYEHIAQEEIDSVKAEFAYRKKRESIEHVEETERKSEDSEENPGSTETLDEEGKSSEDTERKQYYNYYAQILHDNGYAVWSKDINEDAKKDFPYVISPDEYGDIFDYDQIEYTYYADDILADENNDVVTDWQRYMGEDALNHFGEYEEDSIYIRNDMLKTEYAVLLDDRKYVDVMSEYHPEKLDNIPSIGEEEDE